MPISTVWLRGFSALVGAMIIAIPLSAQARCTSESNESCKHPAVVAKASTVYQYKTVQKVSNVNRYRNVTRTSYHDITRTKYHDVNRIKYKDVTNTHYVRHINRIVSITRVQPVIRVHTVTLVHPRVVARVHTRVIPRVHVAVIPRVHTRTVVLRQNQYVSETRMLPTRTAMAGSRTIMAGTRTAQIASNGKLKLMNMVKPRKHPASLSGHGAIDAQP
jgi:hypothetical protein